MKILQVNKFFYPKGGSERYFFDVSTALEEAGHEVIHFSMHDDKNLESPYSDYFIRNIDFTKKKSIRKAGHYVFSLEAMDSIKRLVKKTKPDVAHLHNISHQLTPSIIVALRNKGVPIVQTLHDYQLMCPNYKMFTQGSPCERCKSKKYWNAILYKCIQDSTASSALAAFEMGFHNILLKSYDWGVNRFIAPSKFMHAKMLEWGWQKNQIQYLPHFVDKKRDTSIKKKNQIAFIGRLTREKGAHLLLEAAEKVKDIEFVFAGEGEEADELKKQAKEKNLKHCTFIGFQDKKSVDTLMQESKAVVVPSLWYENAPMVVYESHALGTPVIGARHGGLVELIQEGENGYLFEPASADSLANAIEKLRNAEPLTLGESPFTKETHLQQLEELYTKIQNEHRKILPI